MESNRAKWGWIGGSLLILIWSVFPILWIISLSFKQPGEIGTNPSFLPKQWTWVNYRTVFQTDLFTSALVNSIGNLGGFAGPYAVGFLTDRTGSYSAGVYFMFSTAVASCCERRENSSILSRVMPCCSAYSSAVLAM